MRIITALAASLGTRLL